MLPTVNQAQQQILAPLTPAEAQLMLGLLEKLVSVNNHYSRAPVKKRKKTSF